MVSVEPGLRSLAEECVPLYSEAVLRYSELAVSVTADPGGSQLAGRFLKRQKILLLSQ